MGKLGHQWRGGLPGLTAAVVVSLGGLALSAGPANAASVTVNCAGLQNALDHAKKGDTITLDQMCTKSNSGTSQGHFSLGDGRKSFTLVGKPGTGAGFDGTGVSTSLLSATTATSLTTYTIRHLIFKNASQAYSVGGGAIFLDGTYVLTLNGDTFTDNHLTQSGGAVFIETVATSGTILITHSRFHGNVAGDNGGAVEILEGAVGGPGVVITHDTFTGNAIHAGPGYDVRGGALDINAFNAGLPQLLQCCNRFSGNSVTGGTRNAYGGAESLNGLTVTSNYDVFTGNSIQAPRASYDSEGSALSILNVTCNHPPGTLHHVATDLVIAGNSIAKGAHPANGWGALYLGCVTYYGSNSLTLINSTVSGNRGGGGTAGIWGDGIDHLTLRNSIVAGNSDGADLFGFSSPEGSITASHSDLCKGTSPFTGTGNICANPLLAGAAAGNIRETYRSPTIDRGSNALVPSWLAKEGDIFGLPRIAPKLHGGTPLVDMGAAEFLTLKRPRVVIRRPSHHPSYSRHDRVHSKFRCKEAPGGPGIRSCRDGQGRRSGALLNTAKLGSHTFKVIAKSRDGLETIKVVSYTVHR